MMTDVYKIGAEKLKALRAMLDQADRLLIKVSAEVSNRARDQVQRAVMVFKV